MNRKWKKNNIVYLLIFGGLLLTMLVIVSIWYRYAKYIESYRLPDEASTYEYARHYVMIPENTESTLWQDIYSAASEEAVKQNAYLEFLGDWDAGEYALKDYLEIAIASKVDGIIIEPNGTASMRAQIDKAAEEGIPVITVLSDDSRSERKSFVGPNNYQMGTIYGNEIVNCITENTGSILVLQRQDLVGKELIFREMKKVLTDTLSEEQRKKIDFSERVIVSGNAFDAEEVIRDILNDPENRPDILVCLNEDDSESAYHAIIDYNLVGSIDLIGYYQTDTIVDAIRKGTVASAITVDAGQVGQYCIQALEEYCSIGYVSSYFSTELYAIKKENIREYMKHGEQENP